MRHPDDDNQTYLRVGEAADVLHVSPQTVSRWAREGRIRHVRTAGGHRRFPRDEVERLRAELEAPWREAQP